MGRVGRGRGQGEKMIHGHSGQDWDNVVFRKKAPTGAQKNTAQNINAAMRSGAKVETMKKFGGANTSGASKNAAKLDAQTEAGRLNTVSSDMRKVIQQGRQAKKWSQQRWRTPSTSRRRRSRSTKTARPYPTPRSSQKSNAPWALSSPGRRSRGSLPRVGVRRPPILSLDGGGGFFLDSFWLSSAACPPPCS